VYDWVNWLALAAVFGGLFWGLNKLLRGAQESGNRNDGDFSSSPDASWYA
jgi:hypothetical protein